jgi:GDP-L-fucose synthase
MKNILITGSNGYIAKNILNFFEDKYNFFLISRDDFDLTDSNSTNNFFKGKYFDTVIHTASRLNIESNNILYENLLMFDNLLTNKDRFKHFINLGSGAEIFQLESYYGLSKKIINNIIKNQNNFFNLRIFGIFNEKENDTRFIKKSILNCKKDMPIIIHQNKLFDFFFMDDFLKILHMYIEQKITRKEINCCYKQKKSLLDIARYICDLFQKSHSENIKIKSSEYGLSYIGEYNINSNIELTGLHGGIKTVFEKLIK